MGTTNEKSRFTRRMDEVRRMHRDKFIRDRMLSNDMLDKLKETAQPLEDLVTYYQCAIMEVETKFKVLDQQFSMQYDRNPIESIKSRIKSPESLTRKVRDRGIPLDTASIEENIRDIAGVRVICSFPSDIDMLAECFLKQDDITLIERKDYIRSPKASGYRSLHLIVSVPIFLQNEKRPMTVEVQLRTIAMDLWASLEHKIRYKKEIPEDQMDGVTREMRACADLAAELDRRMQDIRDRVTDWEASIYEDDGEEPGDGASGDGTES